MHCRLKKKKGKKKKKKKKKPLHQKAALQKLLPQASQELSTT